VFEIDDVERPARKPARAVIFRRHEQCGSRCDLLQRAEILVIAEPPDASTVSPHMSADRRRKSTTRSHTHFSDEGNRRLVGPIETEKRGHLGRPHVR
jgi:hypothetical protein